MTVPSTDSLMAGTVSGVGVDSGDYRWHDEYATGGALPDVPRYNVRTSSQREAAEIARLDAEVANLQSKLTHTQAEVNVMRKAVDRMAEQLRDLARMHDDGR